MNMNTIGWVLHGLVAFVLIAGGLVKAIRPLKFHIDNFKKWNLSSHLRIIGLGEVVAGILLAVPFTSPFGVLVASATWGGAIVVHMSHDESYVPAAVFLLMGWAGMVLKYPGLFGIG